MNAEWEEEAPAPPPRKRFPAWAWWTCGGGCLLGILVLGSLLFFGMRFVREGRDPEKQWPRLAEVLAYEQRPEGIELEFGADLGLDLFQLRDTRHGLTGRVLQFPASARGEYSDLMDASASFGVGKPIDPQSGTLIVQGQEVPCLRFARLDPDPEDLGSGIRVDLTGERARPRLLELRSKSAERIEDAAVEAFLEGFQVWKDTGAR